MSISSTGLYGATTIVYSDLFNDVEDLKEQVTTLTPYSTIVQEHRNDISQNRLDIPSNLIKINYISSRQDRTHVSSSHPVVVGAVRGVGGCGGGAGGGVGVLWVLPIAGCVRVSSSVDHL